MFGGHDEQEEDKSGKSHHTFYLYKNSSKITEDSDDDTAQPKSKFYISYIPTFCV